MIKIFCKECEHLNSKMLSRGFNKNECIYEANKRYKPIAMK